ncbi:MAG: type IV secretory system conjugative DNA transfer family protein [Bacilli bacterium]|nr:type IV secretory system conjugative DNA transfer family protein [Bacilli bacterium]
MKFRVDEKDVKIFGIFCVILLYICAIAVLNVHSISTKGKLSGLLPFEAFTPKYIGVTLVLFFLIIIGVLFSVSSHIFEREKGFGFTLQKKDKGYSRWCSEKEMKKSLFEIDPSADTIEHAGIPIISDGKKMWVDDGEAHNLVIGATGSGKTQIVVFPMIRILAKAGESMVLTDPKGELYEGTAGMLKEKGYNIVILNFRDPQKGNAWNPMNLPYKLYKEDNQDKAIELLDDLALNILADEKANDPFWTNSSADYFSGLSLGLFEDATEEQINLNSVNLMSTLGEDRFGGPNNNYIKEYFNGKDPAKPAYINASGTVFAPEETKGGVLSTFKQKIKLFSSRDNLSEMLAYSDFDMKDIGRKKTAVFMIVQDEKKTLHPLATIFIKQCYETLIDVAQEAGGHLPYRTNFILDEFANMPQLKDVTTMVTAARSRHIRFTFIIQNFAQLTQVYGKENAETIKGNCNIRYLISNELQALEEISKMCGEVKSKEKEKTSSTPLVTVSDLQRMKLFEVIDLRLRMMPFKTKFTPEWKLNATGAWGKTYEKLDYPIREKKEVQLFDIKEFVKEQKKKKMEELMASEDMEPSSASPMGNPFAGAGPLGGAGGLFGGGSPMGNPFADSSPFGGSINELLQGNSSPAPASSPSIDTDELIKKIDAKIAELEAEEEEDDEDDENKNETAEVIGDETNKESSTSETPPQEISPPENAINDDDFFDAFFSDD